MKPLNSAVTKMVGSSKLLTMSVTAKKPHPQTNLILEEAYEIAKELNIISKGYDSYCDFIPDLFPEAPKDRVVDVTVFFNTLYYIDNIFGEDTFAETAIVRKPDLNVLAQLWKIGIAKPSNITEINNISAGILRFRRTLLEKSNPAFFAKISKNLFTHLEHALQPVAYSSVQEYIATRRWCGGMDATLDLYDYVYENYLPNEILENHPYVSRLKYLCNLHPTLSNDIFSYPAEQHSQYNLINVLLEMKQAKTLEEAVVKAIELVNLLDREFKILYDQRDAVIAQIPPRYQKPVRQYIESLRNCLAASYDWQVATPRYKHKNHILEDLVLI